VHAWSDPLATWEHDAGLKIPAGVDVELMFLEGALLLERVLATAESPHATTVLKGAIAAAGESGADHLKAIHQRHFEEAMQDVLCGRTVMKQSLFEVTESLIPIPEASALPLVLSVTALVIAIAALSIALLL
jgi:hypothetical protein